MWRTAFCDRAATGSSRPTGHERLVRIWFVWGRPSGHQPCSTVFLSVDNRPTIWLSLCVKTIGIFEAKTKLPSVCAEVAGTGEPVLVSRRGKPLVMISPPPPPLVNEKPDVHTAWKEWTARHGDTGGDDFPEVGQMRRDRTESPFADG